MYPSQMKDCKAEKSVKGAARATSRFVISPAIRREPAPITLCLLKPKEMDEDAVVDGEA